LLNRIIHLSITHRLLVVAISALTFVHGAMVIATMPVDVFPDFTRPTVTVMAEAEGLAPEEVETLVTIPLETNVIGGPQVERVRSTSTTGLSVVNVEFGWGTDAYTNRQILAERLQLAQEQLPPGVTPHMGPLTSIMGTISLIAITSKTGETTPLEMRTLTDWLIRPRILAIPGVAQVTAIGGGMKQYQVLASPSRLLEHQIALSELEAALREASRNSTGGFVTEATTEWTVRNVGRANTLADVADTMVAYRDGVPIRVADVAKLQVGPAVKRGDGGFNAGPAVIAAIYKQPGANTLALTEAFDKALAELQTSLPADVRIESRVFRQADFISTAVDNVRVALRDGALLVIIIVFVFLMNIRTTAITVTALPLSFVITALVLKYFGLSVNTMTLGGLAIAAGALVDDAIVDVENVFRRLRENAQSPAPRPALSVIYDASCEIRAPIVYATLIIVVVVLPLFFLAGVEGRIFMPLAVAFVVSILASLAVSLTLTPALCAYLLPRAPAIRTREDAFILRHLKRAQERALQAALGRSTLVLASAAALFAISLGLVPLLGREFLPAFNEGSLTVNVLAEPGISLDESTRIGTLAERLLLEVPEVVSTGRRTGRAELDEHAEGVHYNEIEVMLRRSDRSRDEVLNDARRRLDAIPGVLVSVGQPISHQIDHMLEGVYAQIAVKVFGPDLNVLRATAARIQQAVASVPGVTDLRVEQQTPIPQLQIEVDRKEAARYGLRPGQASEILETGLYGRVVGEIMEGQRRFDLLLRYDDEAWRTAPEGIADLNVSTEGGQVPVRGFATIRRTRAANQILRENGLRRIVVESNVTGRDIRSVVEDIQRRVSETVPVPEGYFIEYGGQFEVEQQASRTILLLSILSVAGIAALLQSQFGSWRATLQLLLILPLGLIGGIVAILITGGTLSVASLVGFVALLGIVCRCGILLVSHYVHLVQEEGETFGPAMIVRGTVERLAPILMTALTTGVALIPIVLSADEAGREILRPVAVVVLGGLISSTLLMMVVLPVLFYRYGRPIVEGAGPSGGSTPIA
jgi:CzcA family heavy metal efflux pump